MSAEERIEKAIIDAERKLPEDIVSLIYEAYEKEDGRGRVVLKRIIENMEAAEKMNIPLCQDTGMFWCLASIGRDSDVPIRRIEEIINEGCRAAAFKGLLRKSVVSDPVYSGKNTGDNLPVVINYEAVEGDSVSLKFLMKGFGSENCSSVRMLSPTLGERGVRTAVADIMKAAGGKPCPPVTIGVGIGGTMDRAAFLSKKAFFENGDEKLSSLILSDINELGIGPGGIGGRITALKVSVLTEPTHIASLPVAVTVCCWAERRAEIVFKRGEI